MALENFDVLDCINAATQWDDPPQINYRWIGAVCKAAALVKAGMLKTLSTDGRDYAERVKRLEAALEELKRVSSHTCPFCGAVAPWDITHKPDCLVMKIINEALEEPSDD